MSSILQLLIVLSADWDAIDGALYRYERASSSHPWEQVGSPIEINLGRTGMTWAIGDNRQKQEGDGKSPAGLFALGPVFGDEENQMYAKHMPFLLITDDLECVDDPSSSYYNQFVNANSLPHKDWQSSEKMQEIGSLYALGIVVQHNMHPTLPNLGSAIFMHIWGKQGEGSAGCTVMEKEHIQQIVSWLDAKKRPNLVQLPVKEYREKQALWDLPECPSFTGTQIF